MRFTPRVLGSFGLLALGVLTACQGSPSIGTSPLTVLPAEPASTSQRLTPAVRYPLEFLNRTSVTIHVAPNGSKCMNRQLSPHTMRGHTRWEPTVDTKGSGSCAFAASIFYLRFSSGTQKLFDIQFEKKVHTAWVARYSGARSNLIKLCWFGGGGGLAGGLGVLQAENRHCSPAI